MAKISICYIANGDYWSVIHSFESMGFAIKPEEVEFVIKDAPKKFIKTIGDFEVELLVADLTNDERTTDYFRDITNVLTVYPRYKGQSSASMYNDMFRQATAEYVCIITSGIFFQKNWLIELMYYYTSIRKSGVIGIMDKVSDCDYIPLLTNDGEYLRVFIPISCMVRGVALFHRQHLYLIGAFDESLQLEDNEINQFALRCLAMGYYNYCIPMQTITISNEGNYIDIEKAEESKKNLHTSIKSMKDNRNYYIPLESTQSKVGTSA